MNKNVCFTTKVIVGFGIGYLLGNGGLIKKRIAQRKKFLELRALLHELDGYIKANLFNDEVAPEEYHREIQTRIDFINMVKTL